MTSAYTIEERNRRCREEDRFRRLKELESKQGAFYIDSKDLCPLTHTAHKVGNIHKLCSPIQSSENTSKTCRNKCCDKSVQAHKVTHHLPHKMKPNRAKVWNECNNRFDV
jgi:hypothetical protein